MNTSKTIVFFGNERLVSGLDSTDTPILRGLIEAGYDIKAVVSHHSETRSRKQRPLEVAELAAQHGIPVYLPAKPLEIYDELAALKADAAVLAAYGRIVPQKIIDLFEFGIINIHPSLLPKYRGPSPIESAILNGDDTTGVSIMSLVAKMDAGPVYHQVRFHLPKYETSPHLSQKLASLAATELLAALPKIFNGELKPVEQNHAEATYCSLLTKADGVLNPETITAVDAERRVRAFKAFPKTRLKLLGHDIIITKAHVSEHASSALDITFKDGNVLSIDELISPSGKTMLADAFLRGYVK